MCNYAEISNDLSYKYFDSHTDIIDELGIIVKIL